MSDKILSIDISSEKIKVAIISEKLELETIVVQNFKIINEDVDGFAKRFDMEQMWNKLKICIKNALQQNKPKSIIGISSCGQRMASIFLDKHGNEIYGGPNTDIRGIDSAYLIEDKFSDEELFNITAHSPSLMFTLARLLWFKEEQEDIFQNIGKILMLDDWIAYKLTGKFFTDYTSIGESQLFDISKKKWSTEIINAFDINPDIFPEIVKSGTVIGELKPELKNFGFPQMNNLSIIKGCGDSHANLLGMGTIEDGNIGISLGTTTPVHLVINKPIIDPDLNFWTNCHVINDKWLIEANTGSTGRVYDWFKEAFIRDQENNSDQIIDHYLKQIKPGSDSTYAYLGPELMSIKDQTSIKRGVFIFQPPSMVGEELPRIENFARSMIEGICFGILQNTRALYKFTKDKIKIFCSGGMSKSREFCKILANVLNNNLFVPIVKDSAFIGTAMNVLVGLKKYQSYKKIVDELMKYELIKNDSKISEEYKSIYAQWMNLKNKVDEI